MRFSTVAVLLGSALSAIATPTVDAAPALVERDLATITGVISNVQSKINSLDTAIKGYNGGSDVSALQSASDAVVSATNAGVTTVNGSGDLSEQDALQLTGPTQALVKVVQGAISDLHSKKQQLVAACQGGKVLADLNQQKTAANALAKAITSKVPQSLQGIAAQLAGQITTAIQSGITDFTGTDGSCSSSSASSSSASKSSASSSASASVTSSGSVSSSSASATSSPVSLPGGGVTTPVASSTPVATPSATPSVTPVGNGAALNSFSAPAAIAAIAAVLAF